MNIVETAAVLKILKVSYPSYYKDITKSQAEETLEVWAMMFENDEPALVTEAVKSTVATSKFPPTIADIKEKINLITNKEDDSEFEAWNMVLNAINNANRTNFNGEYVTKDYFKDFPEIIQKIVGSPNQLREWSMMDIETVSSVVQSNFMRSYKAKMNQQKQVQSLPESTKAMIQALKEHYKMIEFKPIDNAD